MHGGFGWVGLATQPSTLSGTDDEYRPKCGVTLCGWGVKSGMVHSFPVVDKRVGDR